MNSKPIRSLLLFTLVLNFPGQSTAQQMMFKESFSPRIANYHISAKLDVQEKLITGREMLTWRNTSSDHVRELQFHLYMNAFKNSESTFMQEQTGGRRYPRAHKQDWGSIEVDSIRIVGSSDLTSSMKFIHPDDDNELDQTVMQVKLPRPLPPGQSIQLDIGFRTKLPKIIARTGFKDDFFMVAQWFPKIGVYWNGAWNCHQFHANSEFFADFGVYDVEITLPQKYVVGATGMLVEQISHGDSAKTLVYHAEDVHDFAWTADPNFRVIEEQWGKTKLILLIQPDHLNQVGRHLETAKQTLSYFHQWYGEYPYPTLTIVDAEPGAGGMEYPTLITAGFTHRFFPRGIRLTEMIVEHELGHNYWYGMVASNEFEEAWLDEGINTYSEMKFFTTVYGPRANMIDWLGIRFTDLDWQKGFYLSASNLDPVYRKAWEFYNGGSYAANSYAKPGLVLTTLENYFGQETWGKVMRTYFERWRFRHPRTEDFIAVVNEVTEQDMNEFFQQALFTPEVLDYAVSRAQCWEEPKKVGIGFEAREASKDSSDKGKDSTKIKPDSLAKKQLEAKLYLSEVRVRRLGGVIFPVEVLVRFDDGEEVRETWDGKSEWVRYRYRRPAKLLYAQVDPEQKVVLDINITNNSRTVASQSKGVFRLTSRWLFWIQNLLHLVSFFA